MKISAILILVFLLLPANVYFAQNKSKEKIPAMPKLLSLREQMGVRSAWLKKRFDTLLLPMMRKHGVAMWIVTNEEFHSDAVTESIVPPIPMWEKDTSLKGRSCPARAGQTDALTLKQVQGDGGI